MGAGEVGFHLATTLSADGHVVVLIDTRDDKRARVEERLDAAFIVGNGTHLPVLERAGVAECDLFIAVSSSDEANLAAARLASELGSPRAVVRVGVSEDVTRYRRIYERIFHVDLLLSTQLLAATRILNEVMGYNTLAVEYLAGGKIEIRKTYVDPGSILIKTPLREVEMPLGSLVVAFLRGDRLIIPGGEDRAQPGDEALILCSAEVTDQAERTVSARAQELGTMVIAGAGSTTETVVEALVGRSGRVKVIERDPDRAREFAKAFPSCEVLLGDATDISLLSAERVEKAKMFLALTGSDETNLMASLLAQDLGVSQLIALVDRTETSHLWRKVGLVKIISPRVIAAERIRDYIDHGYEPHIVSLKHGAAQVVQRHLEPASPAAGVTLEEINPPRGLIIGAVMRGSSVFIPKGSDRLEVGDDVILFVHQDEAAMVQLLFPGAEGG